MERRWGQALLGQSPGVTVGIGQNGPQPQRSGSAGRRPHRPALPRAGEACAPHMSFESAVTGAPGPVYELCSGGEDRRSHRTTAEWMLPERSRNFQNSFSPGGIVSRVSSVTRATLLGPLVHPSAACGSRHGRGPQETFTEWSQNEQPPVWVRAAAAWPTKSPVWPRPSSSRQWQQPDVPGEGGTLQE